MWSWVIHHGQMQRMVPLLEWLMSGFGRYAASRPSTMPEGAVRASLAQVLNKEML